jgi:ABC-2 type transport system permease protein
MENSFNSAPSNHLEKYSGVSALPAGNCLHVSDADCLVSADLLSDYIVCTPGDFKRPGLLGRTNNFFSFYTIGLIVGYFTSTIFWSMGFSLKRLMDIGMLETIWVCPISKLMYIIGESLFSMLRLIYEMTIIIIMYKLVFRMTVPPAIWQTLPYFILFIFLMYGFGIAFASLVLLVKDANTMVDTSSFLAQTLSGVQNPPQVFPRFFLTISLAIPITYFLDIIRVHTLNIKPLIAYGLELSIFLAASLLFPIVGIRLFNYIDRKCR